MFRLFGVGWCGWYVCWAPCLCSCGMWVSASIHISSTRQTSMFRSSIPTLVLYRPSPSVTRITSGMLYMYTSSTNSACALVLTLTELVYMCLDVLQNIFYLSENKSCISCAMSSTCMEHFKAQIKNTFYECTHYMQFEHDTTFVIFLVHTIFIFTLLLHSELHRQMRLAYTSSSTSFTEQTTCPVS